jgi:DNA-binding transcriptional MocR family regulator
LHPVESPVDASAGPVAMKNNASIQFQRKLRLLRLIMRQPDLKDRAKLIAWALLDHFNTKRGRCNPSRKVLMADLSVSIDTVNRGLAELEAAGWITRKLTRGAPYYSFAFDRLTDGGATLHPVDGQDGGATLHGWGCNPAPDGGAHAAPRNREEYRKNMEGEASPSPLNGASASPEDPESQSELHPDDLQGERVDPSEKALNLAKLEALQRRIKGKAA